jgi:glycine betaine/choline ABC-type transport system substrate-binding protein
VLEDPRGVFPAYDALVLIAPDRADDRKLAEALKPLVGAIHVEAMREANLSVDRAENKLSPAEAARQLAERLQLSAGR